MQNQHIPTKKIKTNVLPVIRIALYMFVNQCTYCRYQREGSHTQPIDSNAKPTYPDKEDKDKCVASDPYSIVHVREPMHLLSLSKSPTLNLIQD
uniref:Uncharacterized protein n=1 Tax=Solanum tuberosum TaxID=4113 RepID=M1BCX0_SOLTU